MWLKFKGGKRIKSIGGWWVIHCNQFLFGVHLYWRIDQVTIIFIMTARKFHFQIKNVARKIHKVDGQSKHNDWKKNIYSHVWEVLSSRIYLYLLFPQAYAGEHALNILQFQSGVDWCILKGWWQRKPPKWCSCHVRIHETPAQSLHSGDSP